MAVQFKYILTDPQVLGGKPMIKGTRISVECILKLVASGASVKDIVAAYPDLPGRRLRQLLQRRCLFLLLHLLKHTHRQLGECLSNWRDTDA
ncbi:MAG: DUF433 domain-containing protein [Haliscomenobacter sp.]|nr:DUF433 domain-containing protein [Haliscomenobacter sp.]